MPPAPEFCDKSVSTCIPQRKWVLWKGNKKQNKENKLWITETPLWTLTLIFPTISPERKNLDRSNLHCDDWKCCIMSSSKDKKWWKWQICPFSCLLRLCQIVPWTLPSNASICMPFLQHSSGDSTVSDWKTHTKEYTSNCLLMQSPILIFLNMLVHRCKHRCLVNMQIAGWHKSSWKLPLNLQLNCQSWLCIFGLKWTTPDAMSMFLT